MVSPLLRNKIQISPCSNEPCKGFVCSYEVNLHLPDAGAVRIGLKIKVADMVTGIPDTVS